jgi:hypothetical protein
MFTSLTMFVAWFAFGYCVTDIITNWRSQKQIDELVKEIVKEGDKQ